MRLFRVITQHESRQKDAKPGELMSVEKFFAALSIEEVWKAIEMDRLDEGVDVLAIIEHAPSVQVLDTGTEPTSEAAAK